MHNWSHAPPAIKLFTFRQQLEGSWFRSHLNSSAWHTSFQCAVVCVETHRSVSTACGSRRHRDSRSTLTEVCPLWVKTAQNCTSTLTVNTHRSVCPLHVGQDSTETLTVNTHRSVSTVGQDGTELHVDAHGQHSQKCVFTACGSGRHRIARRRSRSTLTEVCVHCMWVRTAQNCTSTLTVDTHRSVCVHSGQDGMHMAGSTRHIWEAIQTVSDHWGFQTEQTTSK